MPITIDQVIREIPGWQEKDVDIAPLYGGFTNENYKIRIEGHPYFVRIPAETTTLRIGSGALPMWTRNPVIAARWSTMWELAGPRPPAGAG